MGYVPENQILIQNQNEQGTTGLAGRMPNIPPTPDPRQAIKHYRTFVGTTNQNIVPQTNNPPKKGFFSDWFGLGGKKSKKSRKSRKSRKSKKTRRRRRM